MPKSANPRGKSWDIRWTPPHQETWAEWSEKDIIKWFKVRAKKYSFQLEKGAETGKYHWQCRVSFNVSKEKTAVVKDCKHVFDEDGTSWYIEPTSKTNIGNDFYLCKEETRVKGPWKDTDAKPRYVQERFRNAVPKPWQADLKRYLCELSQSEDDRPIICVVDEGKTGKSWFKSWMYSTVQNAIILPPTMETIQQVAEYLCSDPDIEEGGEYIFLIDCPRATSPKHWFTILGGLEFLKQGHLCDHRYSTKKLTIEPPQIVFFCTSDQALAVARAHMSAIFFGAEIDLAVFQLAEPTTTTPPDVADVDPPSAKRART